MSDSVLSPQQLAKNLPPHWRRITSQRARGAALAEAEKLSPSALCPILSAAKAALVAVMQQTKRAAAMISIA